MNNKYAIIENTLVTNVAVSDPDYAQSQSWVACADDVSIGWSYINGQWIAPPPPPIPVELTPQEKLANAGLSVDELKVLLGIN